MYYALLAHFGRNLWGTQEKVCDHVRIDESVYVDIIEHMADVGANMLVMDLGEAMIYPSRPELAVKGSWTPEKMQREIARMKALGITAIPKINFSSSHDHWLKDYRNIRCTPEYYAALKDIIRDTCEIFGKPEFVHLGWDEEEPWGRRKEDLIWCRGGDKWYADMNFTADEVRRHGSRPWIWSDKEWFDKDRFMAKVPRDIVQSHWYYSPYFGDKAHLVRNDAVMLSAQKQNSVGNCHLFVNAELEAAGFDQIPCGSNIYHLNNFPDFVDHCLRTVSRKHLLGFLNAPWGELDKSRALGANRAKYLNAVEQLGAARGKTERFYRG